MPLTGTDSLSCDCDCVCLVSVSKLHLSPLPSSNISSPSVAGDITVVRNIVSRSPALLNERMYGFEGHDVYGTVPDNKSGRCYTHTGE